MTTATEQQPLTTNRPLHDKVALVTGGTRGIGGAISHRLAEEGAHVAAGYWRHHEPAEKFMAEMSALYPGTITVHHGNIGDAEDCRRVVREHLECTAIRLGEYLVQTGGAVGIYDSQNLGLGG